MEAGNDATGPGTMVGNRNNAYLPSRSRYISTHRHQSLCGGSSQQRDEDSRSLGLGWGG